jgi:hypothetical protein
MRLKKGIFNYLPSLRMSPLQLPCLRMRLHICHPSIREPTYLPFFHMWQAMSSLPLWISTGNDKTAHALSFHVPTQPVAFAAMFPSRIGNNDKK